MDLTLKHSSHITPWLLRNLREELFAAARRSTPNATTALLLGMLHREPGYSSEQIIHGLRTAPDALAAAVTDITTLVQDTPPDAPEMTTAIGFWRALLDAPRTAVPTKALRSAGRWAVVTCIPDESWALLTLDTIRTTESNIDFGLEIAERCATAPIPGTSTRILLLLQGRGEPWEQTEIAKAAIQALTSISQTRTDENFAALRLRLIELGHHQAVDLSPYSEH